MSIDYHQAGVWKRLAESLGTCELRLSTNCGRVDCPPGWEWRPRLVDYDVWFAVRGRGSMIISGQHFSIRPGALFLLRPGDTGVAWQEPADRLTVIFLHFDIVFPQTQQSPTPVDLPSRLIQCPDPNLFEGPLTRVVRLIEQRAPFQMLEARLLFHQLLLQMYRQDAADQGAPAARIDRRIELAMIRIRSQPEQRLTLEVVAAEVGLAPNYFSRLFRSEVGMSVRDFILHVRLERAHSLLEETWLPIGQIAELLGYSSMYLFSRQFRQHFGYPPSQLRRSPAK